MIPGYRLVLSRLKDIESFIMISGIVGSIVSIIVPEVDSNSSLSAFFSLVDSQIEQTVLKGIGIVEQMKRDVLIEQSQVL